MLKRVFTTDLSKTVYPRRFLINYVKWGWAQPTLGKEFVTKQLYCIDGKEAERQIRKTGGILNCTGLSEGVNYCFSVKTYNGAKHYTPVRATASTKTQRNWARQIRKFGTVESRTAADCAECY